METTLQEENELLLPMNAAGSSADETPSCEFPKKHRACFRKAILAAETDEADALSVMVA